MTKQCYPRYFVPLSAPTTSIFLKGTAFDYCWFISFFVKRSFLQPAYYRSNIDQSPINFLKYPGVGKNILLLIRLKYDIMTANDGYTMIKAMPPQTI
ncbi:hypothetical protein MgSA37_03066 [Mucilaginibacter gotjawali]|uniref:Uncharacterized protein n=2 Tax=Mucilaginibacter gotjawali TaxID=1550579 RepID=A0A839SL84_9SPHI|nr:hypothetical protein [Mucilaginibacter gotjawali]BAU54887.1 hypothetical protein MgSA37_03066 [Mucilaginibacter gotjawali]